MDFIPLKTTLRKKPFEDIVGKRAKFWKRFKINESFNEITHFFGPETKRHISTSSECMKLMNLKYFQCISFYFEGEFEAYLALEKQLAQTKDTHARIQLKTALRLQQQRMTENWRKARKKVRLDSVCFYPCVMLWQKGA